jgi:ribosomal protein S18 acetylase RimI-like enzyme
VKTIIADAKDIGYRSILLDTFPFMQDAIRLYRKFGFQEIESYNGRPMENLVYMKLGL